MNTRLPEFADPPLSEVALAVQFEPLEKLLVPQIGLLWQHYGKRFPHVEQHSRVDTVIERVGIQKRRGPELDFKITAGPSLPRIWFLDSSGRQLLQIQQDRFVRNWRKLDDADAYPRYVESIRPGFLDDFGDFTSFLTDSEIGKVKPTQCEITYVNFIPSNECWSKHAEVNNVFSIFAKETNVSDGLEVEDVKFEIRHLITDDKGEFIGRLYVVAVPVVNVNNDAPGYNLQLIARGRPLSHSVDGIMDFMDLGRAHIVKAFRNVTTSCLHSMWGEIK